MTAMRFEELQTARVIDLAQEWRSGMPHWPSHPPFLYGLMKSHGDVAYASGASSASEALALGGHVGTHLDALCHFSHHGKLHGGIEASEVQSVEGGFTRLGVETVAPIVRRGVLFDIAPGAELPPDHVISAEDLERAAHGTTLNPGDIAVIRTGWGRYWSDARRMANAQAPGPGIEAARWLSAHGIFATGSDTLAYESAPTKDFPVHVHLLVESGIHIIEALNVEELAEELAMSGAREFLFVGAPLKIAGGTGAPMRPFALL
jgi:kynurenine formamidase